MDEAIRTSPWQPAELGRLECRRDFVFAREWNGVFYPIKQVRPIFVDDPAEIVVVTVYVYYLSGAPMRITYDRDVDALYFRFRDTTDTTKHLGEGIAADDDSDGRVAGIEILDAIRRLGDPSVLRQVILEGVGPG